MTGSSLIRRVLHRLLPARSPKRVTKAPGAVYRSRAVGQVAMPNPINLGDVEDRLEGRTRYLPNGHRPRHHAGENFPNTAATPRILPGRAQVDDGGDEFDRNTGGHHRGRWLR